MLRPAKLHYLDPTIPHADAVLDTAYFTAPGAVLYLPVVVDLTGYSQEEFIGDLVNYCHTKSITKVVLHGWRREFFNDADNLMALIGLLKIAKINQAHVTLDCELPAMHILNFTRFAKLCHSTYGIGMQVSYTYISDKVSVKQTSDTKPAMSKPNGIRRTQSSYDLGQALTTTEEMGMDNEPVCDDEVPVRSRTPLFNKPSTTQNLPSQQGAQTGGVLVSGMCAAQLLQGIITTLASDATREQPQPALSPAILQYNT